MSQPAFAATLPKEGVILLHGLCRSSSSMNKMQKALENKGYVVLNVHYESRKNNIAHLSEQVVPNSLKHPIFQNVSKIHFVTHSLGGILVRYYFSKHQSSLLGRVVMLGPPNQGSEVVDQLKHWWLFKKINGPAGSELGTKDSSIPKMLPPVEFELGVIAGNRSINLINSQMMPDEDDGKVSVTSTRVNGMQDHITLPTSHPFIMKDQEAIQQTIHFLQKGRFDK